MAGGVRGARVLRDADQPVLHPHLPAVDVGPAAPLAPTQPPHLLVPGGDHVPIPALRRGHVELELGIPQ